MKRNPTQAIVQPEQFLLGLHSARKELYTILELVERADMLPGNSYGKELDHLHEAIARIEHLVQESERGNTAYSGVNLKQAIPLMRNIRNIIESASERSDLPDSYESECDFMYLAIERAQSLLHQSRF